MLTVGECLFESEDKIMEFLFSDICGNSYVDAGIEALKEQGEEKYLAFAELIRPKQDLLQ